MNNIVNNYPLVTGNGGGYGGDGYGDFGNGGFQETDVNVETDSSY